MRNLLLLLPFVLLISCSKKDDIITQAPAPTEFTGTVTLQPTDKTLYYDIFATNDTTMYLWVKRLTRAEILKNKTFGFNFEPWLCNGIWYDIAPGKKIYAASREVTWGNITLPLDYKSTIVK